MSTSGIIASALSIVTVSGGIGIQIRKILRVRQADQFSITWLVFGLVTWAGWVVYGLTIRDWYLIVPNGIGLVVQTSLFGVVWRFRRTRPQPAS